MESNVPKKEFALFAFIGISLVVFLVLIITNSVDKKEQEKKGSLVYNSKALTVGAPPARSKEEIATRLREFELAEKEKENDLKEFYKTPAGKIYKKHPNWSKEDCERLYKDNVWIGMSFDMLKYKHGLPDHARPSDYGNGTQWQWCWNDLTPSCFYDNDNDGKIDSYN